MTDETTYSLQQAAELLGVHYMTVYKYVRTGRLHAQQTGVNWLITAAAVAEFRAAKAGPRGARGSQRADPEQRSGYAARLVKRLLAGDESGSWAIAQEMLSGGATPKEVYLDGLVPALRIIGDLWQSDAISIAEEHRGSVVAQRLVGRMGPLFRPRGPRIGTVIVGTPAGEAHALPTAIVADILRGEGFAVADLGANVPPESFATYADGVDGLVGIAIAVTTPGHRGNATTLIRTLRDAGITVPILVGGAGVSEAEAGAMGADAYTADADSVVRILLRSIGAS